MSRRSTTGRWSSWIARTGRRSSRTPVTAGFASVALFKIMIMPCHETPVRAEGRLRGSRHCSGDRDRTAAFVKGFGCRPVVTYPPVMGPASESLRGRNPRGLAGGLRLWGFDRPAASARDGRAGVVEGGLPSIIENWSSLLHSTVCFSNNRWHRIGLGRHRGDSGAAPGAACSGGRMVQRGGDGGHDIAVPTPASGDGGPRGAPSRSKVSTMIMRPPQQGHGRQCSATVPEVPVSSCSAGRSARPAAGAAGAQP